MNLFLLGKAMIKPSIKPPSDDENKISDEEESITE